MYTYKPKQTFLTKNLIITVLVVIGSWVCLYVPLYFILRDEHVADFASAAMFWSVAPNLLWGIPVFLSQFPVFKRFRYELLDDEIVVHSGWLVQKVRHVPYRMVTNIEIRRGLLDRWLGIGALNVETAGNSDPNQKAEARLQGLENVDEVYEEVAACLRAFDEAQQSQPWERLRRPAGAAAGEGDEDVLQAILTELKMINAKIEG
jgi:membrane protein YdbS with pleckstrin-like domain